MIYKFFRLLVCCCFICFLFPENNKKQNEKIPSINLKDTNKKKVNLTELSKGFHVLFNFWNMACEPCKKEMKFLNQFHEKHTGHCCH